MNQYLKFILFFISIVIFHSSAIQAQNIVPVFPQANQTITLLDLLNGGLGLRWEDPGNAGSFVIEFRNPTNLIPQLQFIEITNVQSSPYYLAETFRGRFLAGSYSWLVRTADGSRSSGLVPFMISSTDLKATPTPNGFVLEQPSGDLNGSAQIDKPDIYLLAANWKRNLFDQYGADFNLDGKVNQEDILVLASRFGASAVPPTPSPLVGKPGNITFFPNDVIGFAELANFKIVWERPQYPENVAFYEIVIFSQFGQEIVSMRFLDRTEFSLSSLTQDGTYDVFIRAKTTDGLTGNIADAKFKIDPQRVVTPTPNSGVINLDYNGDGSINGSDTQLFIQAFNTFNGDPRFLPNADFNQDGFIDVLDADTFRSNYPNPSPVTTAPSWISIERPVMQAGAFGQCLETGTIDTISIPPFDAVFPNVTCNLAELFASKFNFTSVDGAVDYFYSIFFEGDAEPSLQGFTFNQTFYSGFSILQRDATFIFEIQSVNDGLLLSEKGEALRLTIPVFQPN